VLAVLTPLLLQNQTSPVHQEGCKLGLAAIALWIDRLLYHGLRQVLQNQEPSNYGSPCRYRWLSEQLVNSSDPDRWAIAYCTANFSVGSSDL